MGRSHGAAPLPGVSAVRGPRAASRRGVARALAGAIGLAIGSVQVRTAGSLAGLAPVGAVPALAPDRQQHAVFDPAGSGGDQEPGLAGAGVQPAALERGLGGGAWASVGVGRDLRGPVAFPRRCLRRLELAAGGPHQGLRTPQRHLHGPAQGAQGDVRAPTTCGCAGTFGGPGGPPGVVLSRDAGDVLAPGVTLATGVVRGAAGLPPRPRQEHRLETVLAICALARLSGLCGPAATERFAKLLDQEALRALGAWRNPTEGRWVAPSDSTICRVVADTDPDALAAVLGKWAAPRFAGTAAIPALAADGKRIRGVNRHTNEDTHFETVTLVSHAGHPLASRCCRDEGGEVAATRALLEDVDVRGCLITLDALHTTRDNERTIIETHGADYLLAVKGNCPETFAALTTLDWNAAAVRHHVAEPEQGHGRIDARRIDVQTLPPRTLAFDKAQQVFRVTRERTDLKTGETSEETAFGITSVPEDRADPERLLAWNRGHWQIENGNHYRRDVSLGEDASRIRARHGPANNATLNNIVLAIVFHRGFHHVPEANLHFMMRRKEALDAILLPD